MKIIVSKEDKEYINECLKSGEVLKEDLTRWFKEKWVDVSKKVDGKYPPCGRGDADGVKGRKAHGIYPYGFFGLSGFWFNPRANEVTKPIWFPLMSATGAGFSAMAMNEDGTVNLINANADIGQGVTTALAQIAA